MSKKSKSKKSTHSEECREHDYAYRKSTKKANQAAEYLIYWMQVAVDVADYPTAEEWLKAIPVDGFIEQNYQSMRKHTMKASEQYDQTVEVWDRCNHEVEEKSA